MKRQNAGFTLIELVVVIVILGALAAVAAPRFVDLSEEADSAALQAQASALTAASAMNFAKYTLNDSTADVDVAGCSDVGTLLTPGLDATRYSVSGSAPASIGDAGTCTLTSSDGGTAQFTVIRTN